MSSLIFLLPLTLLHFITLNKCILHHTTPRYTALHYTALHHPTPRYTTLPLHYTNPHHNTQTMSDVGMPLLVHGEVTDSNIDIFDRERVFIDTILRPVMLRFPSLKIVMEHITTEDAVNFILIENKDNANIAATITAHHLLYNRNDIFKGGVCPHMFCLPILKREKHRISLLKAATSGSPKFFIGTDSAPHTVASKESACGCAGEISLIFITSLILIFISSLSFPLYHFISFSLTLSLCLPPFLFLSLVSFSFLYTFLPSFSFLFTYLTM